MTLPIAARRHYVKRWSHDLTATPLHFGERCMIVDALVVPDVDPKPVNPRNVTLAGF
jgi:hypothetical protein